MGERDDADEVMIDACDIDEDFNNVDVLEDSVEVELRDEAIVKVTTASDTFPSGKLSRR